MLKNLYSYFFVLNNIFINYYSIILYIYYNEYYININHNNIFMFIE